MGVQATNHGLEFSDKVRVVKTDGTLHTEEDVSIDEFRTRLNDQPNGLKEVRYDEIIDLTDAGELFVAGPTIPAGSVIKYAALHITELVVAGGTTVKVGLGPNASDPDALLLTGALTKNSKTSKALATAVATQTTYDVCACATNGAAGDTDFSAGKVRVIVHYETPNTIPDV